MGSWVKGICELPLWFLQICLSLKLFQNKKLKIKNYPSYQELDTLGRHPCKAVLPYIAIFRFEHLKSYSAKWPVRDDWETQSWDGEVVWLSGLEKAGNWIETDLQFSLRPPAWFGYKPVTYTWWAITNPLLAFWNDYIGVKFGHDKICKWQKNSRGVMTFCEHSETSQMHTYIKSPGAMLHELIGTICPK